MPSTITSFAELHRRLDVALERVERAAKRRPDVPALAEIRAQLARLCAAERLDRALRDDLDFGQLASRHLDPIEPELCRELYEIASFVAYA